MVALLIVAVAMPAAAQTYSFKTLYTFGTNGRQDGQGPVSTLTLDVAGNLYGTTESGGANGAGTVFRLSRNGRERVLYSFCSQVNCTDGSEPFGGLVMDGAGDLYGTTALGGIHNGGVVFSLSPDGQYTVLYSFCQGGAGCRHGHTPNGNLILDEHGNLYGTAVNVFKIRADGSFRLPCRVDCVTANNGVTRDASGNIYGTNITGGGGFGEVFELMAGAEIVLCGSSCDIGQYPSGPLLIDGAGNLYGVTYGTFEGGAGTGNYGTVFKVAPSGGGTALYDFCSKADCADGQGPVGPVVMDGSGNIYGATSFAAGIVFEITPDGEEIVLHAFCSSGAPCTDGADPMSGLIMDQSGNLYGGTSAGKGPKQRRGTIFELVRQ